ncbi:hypothetical protein [Chryseobacterium culicis]|uniref:hypothetical protein n=1 Tax=Chryseobacterium culicis TaxID=680127 RepID=UPI001873C1D4|nr:hypothetical protein [Chryseobacterium culicis]MBE4949783.1 hypothetical protein [Chryseobacterium culicis]
MKEKIDKSISKDHQNILINNFFGEEEYVIYHTIMFKAEASAGSNITYVLDNGNGEANESNFNGVVWTSPEYTHSEELPAGKTMNQIKIVSVKATGVDATSTLKVQIYIDGVLRQEEIAKGQNLEVTAKYNVEFK